MYVQFNEVGVKRNELRSDEKYNIEIGYNIALRI